MFFRFDKDATDAVVSTSKAGTACANYRPMCRDNGVITAKMAGQRRTKAKDLTINHRVLVLEVRGLLMR